MTYNIIDTDSPSIEMMHQELTELKKAYDDNFTQVMIEASNNAGSGRHKELMQIEFDVNEAIARLKKKLGIYAHDPCPVERAKRNSTCTDCPYEQECIAKGRII